MENVVTLRQRVVRQGVPIRQVARELGVSGNTVSGYLRGEVEMGGRKASARARSRSAIEFRWRALDLDLGKPHESEATKKRVS